MTEWSKSKQSTDFPDAPEPASLGGVATVPEPRIPPPPAPVVTGRKSERLVPAPSLFAAAKPEMFVPPPVPPPPAPVATEVALPDTLSASSPESAEDSTGEAAPPDPGDTGAQATAQEFKIEPLPPAPEADMPMPVSIVPEPVAAEPAQEMHSDLELPEACLSGQGTTAILDLFDFPVAQAPSVAPSEPTSPATTPNEKQPADSPASKQGARAGRPPRLGLCLPILIRGTRTALREEGQTVFVLARGAVITVAATVQVGESLILINLKTGKESECRVVAVQRAEGGKNQVDIEFTQPQPQFWPVRFPPEDWNAEERKRPSKEPARVGSLSEAPNASKPPVSSAASDSKREPQTVVSAPPGPAIPPAAKPASSTPSEDVRRSFAKRERPPIQSSDRVSTTETLGLRSEQPATTKQPATTRASANSANKDQNRGKLILACTSVFLLVAAVVAARMILRRQPDTASVTAPVSGAAPARPQLQSALATPPPAAKPHLITVNAESPASVPPALRASRSTNSPQPSSQQPTKERADSSHARAAASEPSEPVASASKPQTTAGKLTSFLMPHEQTAAPAAEAPEPPPSITGGVSGAVPGSQPGAVSGITSGLTPAAPSLKNPAPVTVGGQIKEPRLLSSVKPVYPQLARNNRVEGDVVIQTTIDPAGNVARVKVVSGPPILQQAALEAIRGWKYEPARLDGEPVSLQMLVTVRFRLK